MCIYSLCDALSTLEDIRRLLNAGLSFKRLLRLNLVVPQCLKLALVVLIGELLILLDNLIHIDLAASRDVVW